MWEFPQAKFKTHPINQHQNKAKTLNNLGWEDSPLVGMRVYFNHHPHPPSKRENCLKNQAPVFLLVITKIHHFHSNRKTKLTQDSLLYQDNQTLIRNLVYTYLWQLNISFFIYFGSLFWLYIRKNIILGRVRSIFSFAVKNSLPHYKKRRLSP